MADMYYVITHFSHMPRKNALLLLYVPELKAFVFHKSIIERQFRFNQELTEYGGRECRR